MKKIYSALKNGFPAILVCVAFSSVGSALFIPAGGIAASLPVIVLCTVIPCLIAEKYFLLPVLFFATTYLFTFSRDIPTLLADLPGGFALFVSLFAAIISLLACLSVCFAKKAVKDKKFRWLNVILASVLLVVSVIASIPLNGTTWGYNYAKGKINNRLDNDFYTDELEIGNVYYLPASGSYACDVKIKALSAETAQLIYKNGFVNENISDRVISELGADTVSTLTDILRQSFYNDVFRVAATDICKNTGRLSVNAKQEIKPYIGYTITIYSEETAKSFTDKVQNYLALLDRSGIVANKITFVGGAKQKLYYRIEVDMGAPHASVADLLKPYDTSLPYSVLNN